MRTIGVRKLIRGVATNDADYQVAKSEKINGKWKVVWQCPIYKRWLSVIERCFSEKWKKASPAYRDVTCCQEWLLFSNFRNWMITQDWEGKELDKDLRVFDSKMYSPDNCCFVSSGLNTFLVKGRTAQSPLPIGVHEKSAPPVGKRKKPFAAEVHIGKGKKQCLGCYATPLGAHRAWQQGKIEQALVLLSDETDPLVIQGLNRVINKIQADYDNGIETTDF